MLGNCYFTEGYKTLGYLTEYEKRFVTIKFVTNLLLIDFV
ncbi:hypothetical protein SAMN05421820_10650 [Pedobacter steynii]|uniref:Uncharacterized protein n=1 Tax=Pedobacter steynii TaxID=430522 RepID=A0A1G9YBS1_9SPHI|nr:hypothetical protein SAMN05421820_10650 [Pedobacter steynii]